MDFEEITEQFEMFAMEMTSDAFSGVDLPRATVERVTQGDGRRDVRDRVGWSGSKRFGGRAFSGRAGRSTIRKADRRLHGPH